MRQRRALLGLTLAACIALVAAGSHPVAQANSSVTLRWSFWSNNPAEIHSNEQIISAFEKQNPGIKVQPIFIPYQSYHSKLLSQAVGGIAPDVMWVQYTYYHVFAGRGILLDTPQAEQAIQFAADLGTRYGVAPALSIAAQSTSSSYFTGQRAAMWWDVGPWWVPGLRQIKGLHWDIAPFPQAPGKPYRLPADNGAFYTIYAHTPHPNEAYKLVRFMLTPTAQKLMAAGLTTSPLLKSVMYSQAYLKAPGMPEHAVLFANENASVVSLFFPNNWLEMQTKLNGYLDPIFLGQSTAAKTLPAPAQTLDAMLTH